MVQKSYDINRARLISIKALAGLKHRDIGDELKCSPSTVSRYKKRLNQAGIVSASQIQDLSDDDFAKIIFSPNAVIFDSVKSQSSKVKILRKERITSDYLRPNYVNLANRLINERVKMQLLYVDYQNECEAQCKKIVCRATFYRYLGKAVKKLLPEDLYMIQDYAYGQYLAIDFAGDLFSLRASEKKYAICVFTWAASNYTFACFTPDMTTKSVVTAFAKAVKYFNCMPLIVLIDNAKCMVTKHITGQDPIFNQSFEYFMRQCNVSIEANNPRAPSSKGMVELSVRLIQDRVLPRMTENLDDKTNDAYDSELQELIEKYINNAGFRNNCTGTPRAELFTKYEKTQANNKPIVLPTYVEFKGLVIVGKSYTAKIDGVDYSVPYKYANKTVSVTKEGNILKIHYGLEVIAQHVVAQSNSKPVILDDHMPEHHKAVRDKRLKYPDAQSIINESIKYGSSCERYCKTVLSKYTFEERKSGLIKLLNTYKREDKSCYYIMNEVLDRLLTMEPTYWNNYSFEKLYKELFAYASSHNGQIQHQTEIVFEQEQKDIRNNPNLGFFRYQSKHSVNAEKAKRDVDLTDVIICDDEHLL